MSRPDQPARPPRAGQLASRLETAALACILLVVTVRPFAAEMCFRISELSLTGVPEAPYKPPEELIRLLLALALLAGTCCWTAALALRPGGRLRGALPAALLAAFAVWSYLSARGAIDARGARTAWLEQLAILAAALVMLNLAADARRRGMVLAVLVALAGTLGLKAILEVAVEALKI